MSLRGKAITCLLLVIITLGIFSLRDRHSLPQKPATISPPAPVKAMAAPPEQVSPRPPSLELVGEEILADYLAPSGSAQEDLRLMNHLFISFDTLVKADDALPLGANGDIADAFRGRNPFNMRFLPDDHHAFNSEGEIIDRWRTPLYFHAESSEHIAFRSAGPDQQMWTDDDIQLEPNGRTFTNRDAILPASMYQPD